MVLKHSSHDDGDDVGDVEGNGGNGEDGSNGDRTGEVEQTEEGGKDDDGPDGGEGGLSPGGNLSEEAEVGEGVVSAGVKRWRAESQRQSFDASSLRGRLSTHEKAKRVLELAWRAVWTVKKAARREEKARLSDGGRKEVWTKTRLQERRQRTNR